MSRTERKQQINRTERKQKIKRKERFRAVAILLKGARKLLKAGEDDFVINQIGTLIDKMYNQKDLRYRPETLVLRAIRSGFCKKDVIEAKTLVSGSLLDETLHKLTTSKDIKYEDGLYLECFE